MDKISKNTEFQSWNAKTKEWYFSDLDAKLIFVGNTGTIINWDKIIETVQNNNGIVLPNLIWSNPHFKEMKKLYVNSNYIMSSAEWINYYPGVDYDKLVDEEFGKFIGKPKYARAWISRINPGKTAPWHWDLDDQEEEFLKNGNLIRYTSRINPPGVGQVTIIGNNALYNGPAGDVYKWPDHRIWHGSVNAGLTPKYQYNYLAYE
jgi:hypothetical protein